MTDRIDRWLAFAHERSAVLSATLRRGMATGLSPQRLAQWGERLRAMQGQAALLLPQSSAATETGDGGDEMAALGGLPRYPGWSRRDWRPQASGPVQCLTVHRQMEPDPEDTDDSPSDNGTPWRFELVAAFGEDRQATVVGRLDRDALRLLVRSDQPLGPSARAHLEQLVRRMRLSGERPVLLRFDVAIRPDALPARREGVDRRA